jgi:hypothetical protein
MTIEPKRTFNAGIVPTCAAFALIAVGAALRLWRLDAMEFKRDEQEALRLAVQFLADRPLSSPHAWPTHGMLSSNGIANAPLFTWIVAAAWVPARDPVGVARVIAVINTLCLYPLWRWARRRIGEHRALLMLAVSAVSPFTVLFSRKIWTQDLLLPGIVALLWGVEWLRGERPWRGVALLAVAVLLVGQLHQAGAIGMLLLPLAIGVQLVVDRRSERRVAWGRPSAGEAAATALALGVNAFFWVPYLTYLAGLPPEWLANRPRLASVTPDLLVKIDAQIVPIDLWSFFAPHRSDFLRHAARAFWYHATVALGVPLLILGLWRWLRSPFSIPVFGIWWWAVIAAFALTRIPSHPSYVMALAPLTALLVAGGFDAPAGRAWISRLLTAWRVAYVAALLALTVATETWLAGRGGAAGDYGVAYFHRRAQAEMIVSRSPGVDHRPAGFTCEISPAEVTWLVEWMVPGRSAILPQSYICAAWIERDGDLIYQWVVKR